MTRRRWMALFFALGSTCFLVGPFPGYVQLVGASADAITFFVGSILFTAGGALQSWLAWDEWRSADVGGRAAWWSADRPVRRDAVLQRHDLSGDACRADELRLRQARLATRLARVDLLPRLGRDRLPRARARGWHGWLPARGGEGWWQPAVNLLGCIFFGISAVAGYVVPSTGSMLDLAAANWNTSLGAACFLACALDTLHTGRASKMPVRRELRELEHELERDLQRLT